MFGSQLVKYCNFVLQKQNFLKSMTIQENVSLKQFNTFGIEAKARYFVEVKNKTELNEALYDSQFHMMRRLVLGGGSNVLFTKDFDGVVIKVNIKGLKKTKENADFVWVKAGAGENWHDLVLFTIENNWGGIENLSLIPGLVGAAPLQNIGAYGVEIKDTIHEVKALNIPHGETHVFDKNDCQFGYRESIFKNEAKDKYVVLSITLKLAKNPKFHVEYGAIQEVLAQNPTQELSIKAVSDAVISIRQSKLPNPAEIGNAGSFFKNPEISTTLFEKLKAEFPEIPSYPINESLVKVPAGWLIEKAGWKGFREGDIGVHSKQALVLVNYGNGTGLQIKDLSEKIQKSILEKFGIKLQVEVNFV
jgi:UDP-N-acetylmuramate dehydrogenase